MEPDFNPAIIWRRISSMMKVRPIHALVLACAVSFQIQAAQLWITNSPPNSGLGVTLPKAIDIINTNFQYLFTNGVALTTNNFDPAFFTVTTNVSIVTNRTLPNWINVKDAPYNAAGDGSDATTAFNLALAAIPTNQTGTIYVPPGKYALDTFTITNHSGVRIIGDSGPTTAGTNQQGGQTFFSSAVAGHPIIQLGDTNAATGVSGIVIQGIHFYGNANGVAGQFGLDISGGTSHSIIKECSFDQFASQAIRVQGGSTLPVSSIDFYGCTVTAPTSATGGILYKAGNTYLTDISWFGGKVNGGATSGHVLTIDGVNPDFYGTYFDMVDAHGILMARNDAGGSEPWALMPGCTLDVAGNHVAVELDPTCSGTFPFDRVRGEIQSNGTGPQIKMQSGAIFNLPPYEVFQPHLYQPTINETLFFEKYGSFTNTGQNYIRPDSNDGLGIHSTNAINITPGTLSGVTIVNSFLTVGSHVFIPNNAGYESLDSTATAFPMLSALPNNNVQLATPSIGGSLLALIQKADQHLLVQIGAGSNVVDATTNLITMSPPVQMNNGLLVTGSITNNGSAGAKGELDLYGTNGTTVVTLTPTDAGGQLTSSGPFYVPDGTAAAPGFGFTGQTNTGWYRNGSQLWGTIAGANAVAFVGGRAFINQLDIGTTVGVSDVQLKSTSTGQGVFQGTLSITNAANANSLVVTNGITNQTLTASLPVFTDANKAFTSNPMSGTGADLMTGGGTSTNQVIITPAVTYNLTSIPSAQSGSPATNWVVAFGGGTNTYEYMELTQTNNIFFQFSTNRAPVRTLAILLNAGANNRTNTLNASWKRLGSLASPFTVTNGTKAILSLTCFGGGDSGGDETNVVAAVAYTLN